MFTFTASCGSVSPQNCTKYNMQHKNQSYKFMKMLAAQKMVLLLFFGVSLAQDLTTSAQLKDIEERLRATEETLKELKRENEGMKLFIYIYYFQDLLFSSSTHYKNQCGSITKL